ncbi:TetR/AcrR family transcriptional regulator [Nocardia shimofusensis]|uniref:TetR/AcrR family transcriptional regulator n=1 Tax=Nocardia shimofusensis TaxID=228596 RepID=UPI0009FF692F|nr:TetR/AcrR family transcriptional regulator [Nocardia shimofusensis]
MTSPRRVNRGPSAAADNRAALIAAAREVFAASGYDVPMSLIARTAGVGQGVLYRHFASKEALALAVFEENIVEVENIAADPNTTVEDVLKVIIGQITTSAAFIAMLNPSSDDPRIFEPAFRLLTLLGDKLADPVQRGAIRAGIEATDIVLAVGMVAGVLARTDAASRQYTAEHAWSLLLHGMHA